MSVRMLEGPDVLDDLGAGLDELHEWVQAPVTARRPWLQAWAASFRVPGLTAVVIEGPARRLDAVALLAIRRRLGTHQVVAVGHGPSDALTLPARDGDAAGRLATAVVEMLQRLPGPWRMILRHLLSEDLVAPCLAEQLRYVSLMPGDVSPVLRTGPERSLRAYVTNGHRQQVRWLGNRMRRDGLDPVITHRRSPEEVSVDLPEVEAVFRARDESMGRRCALDDPASRTFFRRVVKQHAARGELCLTTLRLQGRLAAYALCFVDRGTYRMWNCRFDPRWARYSAGKVAIDAAVEHALADGCESYDFMRGDEPYKDSYANAHMRAQDLRAWSGALLAARGRMFLAARDTAARMERGGGRGARTVETVRRVADRVRVP